MNLLIMPLFETNKQYKMEWHFPFSIWYIGSYWKRRGIDIDLWDMNIEPEFPDFSKYNNIGISCITSQVPLTRIICRQIRLTSNAKITLGGIHPTLFPEQHSNLFDYLCEGDAVPFQDCSPLDYSLLNKDMLKRPKNFLGLVTSKGCPYKCTFCVNSILNSKFDAWPADKVFFEVERGIKMGFKGIFFWDDNFFANKKRVWKFIDLVIKHNLRFEWFAFSRVDHIDYNLLEACYAIGLRRLNFGAESGSEAMLNRLQKGITVQQIEKSAEMVEALGIEGSYSYMIGVPDEKKYDIKATISHLKRMGNTMTYPKIVGPILFCPYPGSKLYERCLQSGWHQPQRFAEWNNEISGVSDSPYKLPWVKHKDMVQVYWFYSFIIPLGFRKIYNLLSLYVRRTNRSRWWYMLLVPLFIGSTVGKLRHKLSYYKFPLETKLFKKLRILVGQ